MAYRVLEVTLLSAKDLKNVNLFKRMEVYAVATISGDPITRQCTSPDPHGGRHPTWNATLRFTVPPTAEAATGCLHVLLRAERSLGDRDVGEVIIPLAEILAGAGHGDLGPRPPQFVSLQVRKVHRTETRGTLYMSYRLGPVVAPQVQLPQPAKPAWPEHAPKPPVNVARPPPAKPTVPPSPKPSGYAVVPSPDKPAVPPSPKPSGYAVVPSPDKPAVPPSPKPSGYVAVPSPDKPAVPPSPKPSGYVAVPSPAKPAGNLAVAPSPKAVGHVAVPPSPKPSVHAVPSPPAKPAGHVAVSRPPKPAEHVVASPRTVKNNGNLDIETRFGAYLQVTGAIGGMLVSNERDDAITFSPEAPIALGRKESGSKTYGKDVVTS